MTHSCFKTCSDFVAMRVLRLRYKQVAERCDNVAGVRHIIHLHTYHITVLLVTDSVSVLHMLHEIM